jgi:hypothetical protein
MIADKDITWQEAAKRWKDGATVVSIELGGIGPGYEQAIQVLLFEIMVRWGDRQLIVEDEAVPKDYLDHVDKVAADLDASCRGFTGSQVGIAKVTAFQFMRYGYAEMLAKAPGERFLIVSKDFPHVE